jgi:hypothetical protein
MLGVSHGVKLRVHLALQFGDGAGINVHVKILSGLAAA